MTNDEMLKATSGADTEAEDAQRPVDVLVMCECTTWARTGPDDGGGYHHKRCPKYATEKRPRLFYYEEVCGAFVPAPEKVANIIEAETHFGVHGEDTEIRFRRFDLTDKEIDELPDAG